MWMNMWKFDTWRRLNSMVQLFKTVIPNTMRPLNSPPADTLGVDKMWIGEGEGWPKLPDSASTFQSRQQTL